MPITFMDIKEIKKCIRELVEQIAVFIYPPVPEEGTQIGPGEKFIVTIKALNRNPYTIQFKNVRWRVEVKDETVAQLIVPDDIPAYKGNNKDEIPLNPGTFVRKMCLFPTSRHACHLHPGDEDEITVTGIAKSDLNNTKSTIIEAQLYVEVDQEWLFPQNEETIPTKAGIIVEAE